MSAEKNKHVGKRNPKAIGGHARSHHIANVTGDTLRPILFTQIDRQSTLMTDTAGGYHRLGKEFARHSMVNHGKDEYVRGHVYGNTVEGFFSVLKRCLIGTYHHVSEAHLKRYLVEFDFRYNHRSALKISDTERTDAALAGIGGKRSPIGGLVKPVTLKQRLRRIKRIGKRFRDEPRDS